jgi:Ca-activated chloride channel family protein
MRSVQSIAVAVVATLTFLTSCGLSGAPKQTVEVSIVYGSEKQEWLEQLVQEYNLLQRETDGGSLITVTSTPMGSIESARAIVEGQLQPTLWSPASSVYIPVANAEWRAREHPDDLIVGDPPDLVLSPVVVALWRPMAEALGWPERKLGWAEVAALSTSEEGWEAFGYPEWGSFKFGHTHPDFSNSGLVSVIAEAYAGAAKQRGLTLDDLKDPDLRAFMAEVESSVIHYGSSTGFFAERMFDRGPSYLSAAVMYENLVVAQETKRRAGQSAQIPVVAIYPIEGTFWSNHPCAILNASWVTPEQRTAAEDFRAFLLERPQQQSAIELGFRPADQSIPLTNPLDAEHGVDPRQPQTVLEIPTAAVIAGIQDLWRSEAKKPVDLVVVMDVSGSMKGGKIMTARQSLLRFINLLEDRDRLQIILFSAEITTLTPLSPLGEKREEVERRVSGIVDQTETQLYAAVTQAYQELLDGGDPRHIRAMVVLSDGADSGGDMTLDELLSEIGRQSEAGDAPKIFTIAFGQDADSEVLQQIAEVTGGRQYVSEPSTIGEVYGEIATFF